MLYDCARCSMLRCASGKWADGCLCHVFAHTHAHKHTHTLAHTYTHQVSPDRVIAVSAKTGAGVDILSARIQQQLFQETDLGEYSLSIPLEATDALQSLYSAGVTILQQVLLGATVSGQYV
jgi:hypothetical protein